ncbi:hypothetical protein AAVH_02641 [Aphelenchoides avenae]|nr:hypothetical protein AAVH_02641 [Aphelenchus avenae]
MDVTLVALAVLHALVALSTSLAIFLGCGDKKKSEQQSAISNMPTTKSVNPVSAPKVEKSTTKKDDKPKSEKQKPPEKQKPSEKQKQASEKKNKTTMKGVAAEGADEGYENCADITPSQLEKIAKEADQK